MADIKIASYFTYKTMTENVDLLLSNLKTNEKQRVLLESMTKEQNSNAVWHMARMRRLTASNFGRVIHDGDLSFLLADSESPKKITFPMRWGLMKENTAREMYAQKYGVVVDKIGFLISESGILGGTPDGIVRSERKLIEIKCPFTLSLPQHKGQLHKLIKSGKHWLKVDEKNKEIHFDKGHTQGRAYYHQIQGCLYLAGDLADSCDLVVWGPCDWLVINIKKDPYWYSCYGAYLERFWKTRIAPQVVSLSLRMVSINTDVHLTR